MAVADDQLQEELGALLAAREANLTEQALRSLDERGASQELVAKDYSGRYPLELLQNAGDAAAAGDQKARVRFDITPNALLASNTGVGFRDVDVRAICSLARSAKDPAQSIGYKGLGFKAVNEISATPQVVSGDHRFMFDPARAIDAIAEKLGVLPDDLRVPVYAFPFPIRDRDLGSDEGVVAELEQEGYVTTLRLPLKEGTKVSAVEAHLQEALDEGVLLLVDSVDELDIRGPSFEAQIDVSRNQDGIAELVALRTAVSASSWIVYRYTVEVDSTLVVEGLGKLWKDVETLELAVAFPLSDQDLAPAEEQAVRVYFPTEEASGLPFILHGDFALELDRRHLAANDAGVALNDTLLKSLAGFVTETVLPDLVRRYPESTQLISALAPLRDDVEATQAFHLAFTEGLSEAAFVRCIDGVRRRPGDVVLLPPSAPPLQEGQLSSWFDFDEQTHLVDPRSVDRASASFPSSLGAKVMGAKEMLTALDPAAVENPRDLMSWLLTWDRSRADDVPFAMRTAPTVPLEGGGWARPDEGVLLPAERKGGPEVPAGLPLKVAALPNLEGLPALMVRAGVKLWAWRDLLLDQVLPILVDENTPLATRRDAWITLQSYLRAEGGGDKTVAQRFGASLLPTAIADDASEWELRRADQTYFSAAWLDDNSLERIYGPFGEKEFLAFPAPEDGEGRMDLVGLFRWMGVQDRPRVDTARAADSTEYRVTAAERHPHKAFGKWWTRWLASDDFAEGRECPQGHDTERQQLLTSFGLDRMPELVRTEDANRLAALFTMLAAHWGETYEACMTSTMKCQHGFHNGMKQRPVPSLLSFLLRELPWVPAVFRSAARLEAPSSIWRASDETPANAQIHLLRLDPKLDVLGAEAFSMGIGIVDGGRATPEQFIDALRRVAEPVTPDEGIDHTHQEASKWLMRRLDEQLRKYPETELDDSQQGVPLLSRDRGELAFVALPYYCDDDALADAWGDSLAILQADKRLTQMRSAMGLPYLGEEITTEIVPVGPITSAAEFLNNMIQRAAPYLSALSVDAAPSRAGEVRSRLPRLRVVACDKIRLEHSLGDEVRESSVRAYLTEEVVTLDRRRTIGTLYLEVIDGESADWYAAGPLLAEHLQVGTQGDAFALILAGSSAQRAQFLKARGIDEDTLQAEMEALGSDHEAQLMEDLGRSFIDDSATSALEHATEAGPDEDAESTSASGAAEDPSGGEEGPAFEPPPLDIEGIEVRDTQHPASDPAPRKEGRRGGKGGGGGGQRPDNERNTAIGDRGEEAVYEKQREIVASFGFSADEVEWTSKLEPLSAYDIKSLDQAGRVIYIEVKSTVGSDPEAPFPISLPELYWMMDHRESSYLYRVTETLEATPVVTPYEDPIGWWLRGAASIDANDARMRFEAESQDE